MASILIIDSDKTMCAEHLRAVSRLGHAVISVNTMAEGTAKLDDDPVDVVFLDVRMPDGNGLAALPDVLRSPAKPEVIVTTGLADPDDAEAAIRCGAWTYVEKPISESTLRRVLSRAVQYRKERRYIRAQQNLTEVGIVGDSAALNECLDQVAQAAAADINVLITGETGTGKELFARAIHENRPKAESRRFVVVDCTSLPKTLVESVLFGHEKGAYTGADQAKEGLIKQADGGTLFLDEIGELPIEIQKKFLRVLQEKHYRPVGGKREEKSNFRVISATNRDLDELVSTGAFREDLLFRLRAMSITLPPLRERREDIKTLALHQIETLCEKYQTAPKGFSADFFDTLCAHDWPGNVRELYQSLETAFAAAGSAPTLFPKDLPAEIRAQIARKSIDRPSSFQLFNGKPAAMLRTIDHLPPLKEMRVEAMATFERQYLMELLVRTSGKVQPACKISGLSRSRLYTLLKKHDIVPRPNAFPTGK